MDPKDYFFFWQRKYASEIVNECDLLEGKPVLTPFEENHKLAFASRDFF